jgi:hypothetical protein
MTAQAVRMYFLLYKAGAMPFFVVDYSLGWPRFETHKSS